MGYSIYLKIKTGENEYVYPYEDSCTYNVAPMFSKALGEGGIRQLCGVNSKDAIDLLSLGIGRMTDNPEDYKELNPSNGWGSYEGALQVLLDLKEACLKHEYCVVEIY